MQIVGVMSDNFYEPETMSVALYKVIRIFFSLVVIVLLFHITHG